MSGFEEMCAIRWSAQMQDLPVRVPEDRVGRAVPRAVLHLERSVAELQLLAVVERARDLRLRPPGAEASRDGAQRRPRRPPGFRGGASARRRTGRRARCRRRSSRRTARRRRSPRRPRPIASAMISTSPRWSMCWWVRTTSSMSAIERPRSASWCSSSSSDLPELGPVSTRVSGLVLDQIAVDAADGERRRNLQAMDAGLARLLQRLLGLHINARQEQAPVGVRVDFMPE